MSVITPSSDLYLLHAPLEADMNHQLNFSDAQAQFNYFSGLSNDYFADNFTYIRKDGRLTVEACMDDIITCNYLIYRNTAFGDKWFYAFITRMEFASPNSTHIYFKTDVWQTWQFDINIRKCFVEREHVNNDTIGLHTLPENLECGEYLCNSSLHVSIATPGDSSYICMQISSNRVNESGTILIPSATYPIYSGIPQGCYIIAFPYSANGMSSLRTLLGLFDANGRGDAVLAIFLVPKLCTSWTESSLQGSEGSSITLPSSIYIPEPAGSSKVDDLSTINLSTSLNGYTPKNNKLFTYPYNYLYLTNNNGGDVIYHYEDFFNNAPEFTIRATLEQGGGIYVVPKNSKKGHNETNHISWNEGLSCGKLPQLSWTSDYYLNWQATNATNLEIQTGIEAVQWGAGTITSMVGHGENPGVGTGLMSFASDIANTMQQVKQAKMIPDQAKGNLNSGDITYASGQTGYWFRNMCIRSEFAKIIDEYFSMFGYKVNETKVPNLTGRTNWNYVKLHDANILGNIPQADMQGIKSMFEKGVTIWHNPNTFMDYTQSNNIV